MGLADRAPDVAGSAWGALSALARRRDESRDRPLDPGLMATTWGAAKTAALVASAPACAVAVAALSARNTLEVRRRSATYDSEVLAAGHGGGALLDRVERIDAGDRWLITSDLHRCVPGRSDWPGRQGTRRLYEAMLDHYGAAGWGLVENGDVEDFWLTGGSTYGALYDVGRLAGAAGGPVAGSWRRRLYGEHLDAIVAHNAGVYERINRWFHLEGRYRRVIGNHDDVYADPAVAERLRSHHPGLEVLDAVALEHGDALVGLVTHGHHTDAWNAPGLAFLGQLMTWWHSAMSDAPVVSSPGEPGRGGARRLLDGRADNVLTSITSPFGVTEDLLSVDEVELFDAFRHRWGDGDGDLEDGPVLVLGHTHAVRTHSGDPTGGGTWGRYLNSGSGVEHEMVTAVEWDGRSDPLRPELTLVAWSLEGHGRHGEVVTTTADGRGVRRCEMRAEPDGRLVPADPVGT